MFAGQKESGVFRNLHIYAGYWIAYLIFFSVQRYIAVLTLLAEAGMEIDANELLISFLVNLIYLPFVIFASHLVVSYFLPKFYFNKRFKMFGIFTGLTIVLYPLLAWLVRYLFVDPLFPPAQKYGFSNYYSAMLIFVFGMAPLAWYEIAKHLREEYYILQKLDKDRLEALLKLKETELKLLKSQIQPHFLFNTLNNLYSLALEKSDKTPELIIRLSDMLSYIIYDCKEEKVPLSKEIEFIRNYLELQKVRYDTCKIDFSYSSDNAGKMIAPMILQTFVDNSFKHGAEKDPGNPWIKIDINSQNGSLLLSVINSLPASEGSGVGKEGIGIMNTKKRLDFMYNQKYELKLNNSGKEYSVFLKMQL